MTYTDEWRIVTGKKIQNPQVMGTRMGMMVSFKKIHNPALFVIRFNPGQSVVLVGADRVTERPPRERKREQSEGIIRVEMKLRLLFHYSIRSRFNGRACVR